MAPTRVIRPLVRPRKEPMNARSLRLGLAAAVAATLAVAGGPAASAGDEAGAAQSPATVLMKFNGKRLLFDAPQQVSAGQTLQIVNRTKTRRFGPHTFSLVEETLLPDTRQERRGCFAPRKICLEIALAHEFDPRTERVDKKVVRAGRSGWSKMFTRDAKGDSWYTEKLGTSFGQPVTAEAGSTLSYMCAVHPEMQGKIEVVE